jgi:hypothetical protein
MQNSLKVQTFIITQLFRMVTLLSVLKRTRRDVNLNLFIDPFFRYGHYTTFCCPETSTSISNKGGHEIFV